MPHLPLFKKTIYVSKNRYLSVKHINMVCKITDVSYHDRKRYYRLDIQTSRKELVYEECPNNIIMNLRFNQIKALIDKNYEDYRNYTTQLRNTLTQEQLIKYAHIFE